MKSKKNCTILFLPHMIYAMPKVTKHRGRLKIIMSNHIHISQLSCLNLLSINLLVKSHLLRCDFESRYLSLFKRVARQMWFSKQILLIDVHFSQLDRELRVWFNLFVGCLDTLSPIPYVAYLLLLHSEDQNPCKETKRKIPYCTSQVIELPLS